MKITWLPILMIGLGLMVSGCGVLNRPSNGQSSAGNSSIANGEQIYFTGQDQQGNRISYTGGPNFGGMMMGSYLTCAACHGPDAHGGQHVMHMQVMDAPAIYYDALNTMSMEELGEAPQAEGYSLEDFRTAVVDGHHPDGDMLGSDMPRWKMSDQDLADVFAFLKTIQK